MSSVILSRPRCVLGTAVVAAALIGGCADIPPGPLAAVQPITQDSHPRVGQAYLFRGFIGIFSTGMNQLGEELNSAGVDTIVFQSDQWSKLADTLADRFQDPDHEPIVLVGHSYGADNIIRVAQALKDRNVEIDLLLTLDPVTPPKVPANVKRCVNLYQSNGAMDSLPWLRGIPLEAEKADTVDLLNENIRTKRTDLLDPGLNHFNIEKKEKIHAEIIKQVLATCPPRQVWARDHALAPALAGRPQPATAPATPAGHAMPSRSTVLLDRAAAADLDQR